MYGFYVAAARRKLPEGDPPPPLGDGSLVVPALAGVGYWCFEKTSDVNRGYGTYVVTMPSYSRPPVNASTAESLVLAILARSYHEVSLVMLTMFHP